MTSGKKTDQKMKKKDYGRNSVQVINYQGDIPKSHGNLKIKFSIEVGKYEREGTVA